MSQATGKKPRRGGLTGVNFAPFIKPREQTNLHLMGMGGAFCEPARVAQSYVMAVAYWVWVALKDSQRQV